MECRWSAKKQKNNASSTITMNHLALRCIDSCSSAKRIFFRSYDGRSRANFKQPIMKEICSDEVIAQSVGYNGDKGI